MNLRSPIMTVAYAALWALVVLIEGGCATIAPTRTEATAAPPRQSGASSNAFAFAQPDAAKVAAMVAEGLSLAECIALALNNNPELLALAADADAARAESRGAGAARWPRVGLTGNYFHHQDAQRIGVPAPPGQPQYFAKDIAAADIILRLPLYSGGRIINEFRAADLLAQAQEYRLGRSRSETVFNITSTYYGILAQEKVVESSEFSLETLKQHLARVESLIAAQKAARVDALRTAVRLADVEHKLLQETNVRDIQYRLLANLIGLPNETVGRLRIDGELAFVSESDAVSIEEVVTRAFEQRNDYAAALAELEAQASRVDIARGLREPEVYLEASYGGRWGFGGTGTAQVSSSTSIGLDAAGNLNMTQTTPLPGGGSFGSTWGTQGLTAPRLTLPRAESADSFEDIGRLGIVVNIPLFEGGRLSAQIERERARLRAAQQRLLNLELQIWLETETAVLDTNSARRRVMVTGKSIAEAEESLRIEQQKYELGKGAIVDVLDAQQALLNAQSNHYRAVSDYHVAQARVRLAAGDEAL